MTSLRLPKMLYRPLGNTGISVSILGFGASPLGDVFNVTDPEESERAVHLAIDSGINFFDVSPFYGLTLAEERLGKALHGCRKKAILATKCGRYGAASFDFSRRRILASIDESLSRLRTDYVDLLQAHDIEFAPIEQIRHETLPALREVQRAGKARFIGISGYPLHMLRDVVLAENVDTVLSYCHYDLLATDLDTNLTSHVRAKGIGLINASPLHMGLLTHRSVPAWHPAPQEVKEAAAHIVALCRQRGVEASAVALRFCIDYPHAALTLVGMSTSAEVEMNLKALELELDPELMRELERIVASVKNTSWSSGLPENNPHSNPEQSVSRERSLL